MARTSQGKAFVLALASLAPLLGTGCIIAEAPDYGATQRTPVFMYDPYPTPYTLQVLNTKDSQPPISFTVTVRSEDAGERLVSAMYVDYKHKPVRQSLLDKHTHPPSTFDYPRTIKYPVSPDDLVFRDGVCHSLTLMVMHESSWDDEAGVPRDAPEDLALMPWFLSVNDVDGVTLLASCPTTSTGSE